MQHSCHVRFMVNIIDVSILVVITVRVCGMFLSRLLIFPTLYLTLWKWINKAGKQHENFTKSGNL